ncbi:hypothetical protein C2S51_005594 [Perilla frutescens var. frutescens]|nr:hypothetical protein C2S51_005594 [Perilla frutescens var. frutescens]
MPKQNRRVPWSQLMIDEVGSHIAAAATGFNEQVDHKQWIRVDYLVFSWIVNSITKELGISFQHLKNSKDLWIELKRRFGRMNGPRIYKLRREIATYNQGNQSVLLYYNNLQALWDEIHIFAPCQICACGAIKSNKHNEEDEKLMQFLMGLSDHYEAIRNQILILEPLPSVSQAYFMILQVEEQKDVSSQYPEAIEHNAFYSNPRNFSSRTEGFRRRLTKEEKQKLKCAHCGVNGHEKADCFELAGFLITLKKKIMSAEVAKYLGTFIQKSGSRNNAINSTHLVELDDKNEEQKPYMAHYALGIMDIIHKDEWIIDSGANIHMCCNVALMQTLRKMDEPQKIYLPDGSSIVADYSGEVQLTKHIKLHKVLFAPAFTHNLISVGELTKDIAGRVLFFTYTTDLNLRQWHEVLGHPSIGAMKHLPLLKCLRSDIGFGDIRDCAICFKSKQQRLFFPPLHKRSQVPFELIHADVWGSYHEDNISNTLYILITKGRSSRLHNPPSYLQDFKTGTDTMSCNLVFKPFFSNSALGESRKPPKILSCWGPSVRICCSSSADYSVATEISGNNASLTGGAYDFDRATTSLSKKLLSSPKKVTLVRHGYSTWNKEGRVQGSSDLSVLTEEGIAQAERCRTALTEMHFDQCFSSPISRAKSTAEILWQGREQPLVYLDSLKEAHLYFLEGLRNVDARKIYPKEFTQWREDPSNLCINGDDIVDKLWERAREAWLEILFTPGESFLVVTHKSILRALFCTALGLGPERFRAIDVNNGGLCVFSFNKHGEAMLRALNMTAHIYTDHIYHY